MTAAAVVGARPAGAAAEDTIERTSRVGGWVWVRAPGSQGRRGRRVGVVRVALACVKYPRNGTPCKCPSCVFRIKAISNAKEKTKEGGARPVFFILKFVFWIVCENSAAHYQSVHTCLAPIQKGI